MDPAQFLGKLSDPVFTVTLLEFLLALSIWVYSLVKKTSRRRFWFFLTLITFFIFMTVIDNPYVGN